MILAHHLLLAKTKNHGADLPTVIILPSKINARKAVTCAESKCEVRASLRANRTSITNWRFQTYLSVQS